MHNFQRNSKRAQQQDGRVENVTNQEALDLIRSFLKAPSEADLLDQVNKNLPRIDGTFFTVRNRSVEQLRLENKPQIATALEHLGDTILKMRTLI